MKNKAKKKLSGLTESGSVLRRVLPWLKPYWAVLALGVVFSEVSVGAALLVPVFIGRAIDGMLAGGGASGAVPEVALIALLTGASAASQWLSGALCNKAAFSVTRDLRDRAVEKLQRLPLAYYDTHAGGETASRIIADAETFTDGLLMSLTQLFTGVLTIIGTLCFMISVSPSVSLVVIILTPASFLVAGFIAGRTHGAFGEQTKLRGVQTAFADEMISGGGVIRSMRYEGAARERFDEMNRSLERASLRAVFFSSLTNPGTRFVNNIIYACVALLGAVFAGGGGLTVGSLTVFLSYAGQYARPFNEISGVVSELQGAIAGASRVIALLDECEEEPDSPGARVLEPDGSVELSEVSFGYPGHGILIKDFSLRVEPGTRVAIVGPTGCGKTTLINLLMRFYDVSGGFISFSGVDSRELTRASLRSSIGMVLQETWLRTGTVRENIAFGRPGASDGEIEEAARLAYAHGFISRLPQGYDTLLSENGGGLSAGQKQLLCIARVMLVMPPLLILDEATSSIDTRTEMKIQSAFARLTEGKTSFTIAHRLRTIRDADIILVMRDGAVIEQGKHSELMRANGFYASLYGSRFGAWN